MMYAVMMDLKGRPRDQYTELEKTIKALGNWSNRLESGYILETDRFNASQIRDFLKPHLVAGQDKLFVARVTRNWAGTNMGNGFQEWMDRRNFDGPQAPPTASR